MLKDYKGPNSYGAKVKVHETSYMPVMLGSRPKTTLALKSKTTLRFNNLLEGLKNSMTAVMLMVMVYYSRKTLIISQDVTFLDSTWGGVQKSHSQRVPICPLPVEL